MPIYEYQCQSCEHEFETIQKISDAPLTECPECGKPALKKKISAVAFRLKGGGWYETDFKSGDKKNVVSADKDSGGSSSSSESSSGAKDGNGSSSASATKDGAQKDAAKSETKKDAAVKDTAKKSTGAAKKAGD